MRKTISNLIVEKVTFLIFLLSIGLCIRAQKFQHHQPNPFDVSILDFKMDDIFSDDLIPVQMMSDQLVNLLQTNLSGNGKLQFELPEVFSLNNTDINSAVSAMRYHRRMMNQFKISGYLASQIVASISNVSSTTKVTIGKRIGTAKNDSGTDTSSINLEDSNQLYNNHKLIEDEGSSRYSSWLKKLATFEDIQNQLQNKKTNIYGLRRKDTPNRRQTLNINVEPTYGEMDSEDGLEYLEDGDITGYAYTNTPNENVAAFQSSNPYKNHQKSLMEENFNNVNMRGISKTGYDNGYDDHAAPQAQHPRPQPVSNLGLATPSKQIKEIGLKDITDIALTTLAFLSFGMFILQVLMCITMSKDDTSNMVMLPMEGTENGDLPGDDNTEEIRRKRRSVASYHTEHIEKINNLAKRALFSLNAVTSMSNDEGRCHYYSLCENNRFARHLHDRQKLWIPIWSLGISWLTTKFQSSNKSSQVENYNPVMNSLKAIFIGLSNGNCVTYYNDNCVKSPNVMVY